MKTTIKQMAARANSGHVTVLKRLLETGDIGHPLDRVSDIRGLKKCYFTLRRWGCIENDAVTETGHELLKAKDSRND
jgi:hypothetical protein